MTHQVVQDYIAGRWATPAAGPSMDVYNPSTGEVIAKIHATPEARVKEAVQAAKNAFADWSKTSAGARVEYLFKLRHELVKNKEELARLIAVDQAKHISDARGEVSRAIQITETACAIPLLMGGGKFHISKDVDGEVIREPIGVIGAISPFNFPALVFGWFVPFAIGCGNTLVYKASELSPLFMQRIAAILETIGLPPGVFNLVNGDSSVGEMILRDRDVQGASFVGSTKVGSLIAQSCAAAGKKSMILAGAKNTSIVAADANLDGFIENIINACYGAAGQRCMSTSNIAIVESVYEEVKNRFAAASKQVKVGDACDETVYMGPLISRRALEKIHRYIDITLAEGGSMILDGRNVELPEANKNGYFVGPTIIENVTPDMTLAKEEAFGPLVALMKIKNIDEGIAIINRSEYGNGGTIYTESGKTAQYFINQTNSGMLGVNIGVPASMPYLPFGGTKNSLLGSQTKAQGVHAIEFFTKAKAATVRFYGYGQKEVRFESECCTLK